MKKNLLTSLMLALSCVFAHAQTISITGGQFGNWSNDVDLHTTDNIYYTLNGVNLEVGEIKFRQDHGWDVSFGSPDFPVGMAQSPGSNINVTQAGTYNITFNRLNGVYTFVTSAFPTVSLIGENIGTPWGTDVDMNTTDGINYTLNGYEMQAGDFKFRVEHSWSANYGSGDNGFPSGFTAVNGGNINAAAAGIYDISFNRNTGSYIFVNTLAVSETGKKKVVINTLVKDELLFSEMVKGVEIFSMDGKLVKSYHNINRIDLQNLTQGQYLLKIQTLSQELLIQKIIKN